jgi:hypothetical protein
MGDAGRLTGQRRAWQMALSRGKPDDILLALRNLHTYRQARISDDAAATVALAEADDPRWRLAAGQLLAAITRALRLDLDGVDDALALLEGLPDTAKDVRRLASEAAARLAGPPAQDQ